MYTSTHFGEERIEVLGEFMRANPFATLVTLGKQRLNASHIPLFHEAEPQPLGTLRGHLAKANPQWQDVSSDVPALVIFAGPPHYISPSWYPSKAEHGKVVPTWNYSAVHAYGRLTVQHDREWLRRNVEELTGANEQSFSHPWHVDDAPAEYIERMLQQIVGVEIALDRVVGAWKVSQNRTAADRAGVVQGLEELGTPQAREMAKLVKQRGGR